MLSAVFMSVVTSFSSSIEEHLHFFFFMWTTIGPYTKNLKPPRPIERGHSALSVWCNTFTEYKIISWIVYIHIYIHKTPFFFNQKQQSIVTWLTEDSAGGMALYRSVWCSLLLTLCTLCYCKNPCTALAKQPTQHVYVHNTLCLWPHPFITQWENNYAQLYEGTHRAPESPKTPFTGAFLLWLITEFQHFTWANLLMEVNHGGE